MELVWIALVIASGLISFYYGYRDGQQTERASAITRRRLEELSYYGPRTSQSTTTSGSAEWQDE